jgi:hypothetical protein
MWTVEDMNALNEWSFAVAKSSAGERFARG